jgi:hypothetical protein
MIVSVSRKPRDIEHDHVLNTSFVRSAVLEKPLKLRSICGLSGFASVLENLRDLKSVTVTVVNTAAKLRRERKILGLFFG